MNHNTNGTIKQIDFQQLGLEKTYETYFLQIFQTIAWKWQKYKWIIRQPSDPYLYIIRINKIPTLNVSDVTNFHLAIVFSTRGM
jgi:uncharacterized protein YggT (Ycf19 family)